MCPDSRLKVEEEEEEAVMVVVLRWWFVAVVDSNDGLHDAWGCDIY